MIIMKEYYHSVVLDKEKCIGCTNCIKNCPTQAIRVRHGKATIIKEKCIDCGECIRICPQHAKNAITDTLKDIKEYKYKVAIPAPSLLGQFPTNISADRILTSLKMLGFDEVVEVAFGAEIIGEAIKYDIEKNIYKKPYISSACPAVVRLIQDRFPALIDNIIKLESPMEVTAKITRERLISELDLKNSEIGIFFITPCAAKVTSIKSPYQKRNSKSAVSGTIAIRDVFGYILKKSKDLKEEEVENIHVAKNGIIWAKSGGESTFIKDFDFIHVDGIHNVLTVLEEMERGNLNTIEYFEGLACIGGCVGGCLTVENNFIAKRRISTRWDENEEENTHKNTIDENNIKELYNSGILSIQGEILPCPEEPLDEDIEKAIKKAEMLEKIEKTLPGFDCGSCGAPGCRALAEDIVRGKATEVDCIFVLKEAITELSKLMLDISGKVVPVMKDKEEE